MLQELVKDIRTLDNSCKCLRQNRTNLGHFGPKAWGPFRQNGQLGWCKSDPGLDKKIRQDMEVRSIVWTRPLCWAEFFLASCGSCVSSNQTCFKFQIICVTSFLMTSLFIELEWKKKKKKKRNTFLRLKLLLYSSIKPFSHYRVDLSGKCLLNIGSPGWTNVWTNWAY